MNMSNARKYIPMLEALADGELEIRNSTGEWVNVRKYVRFDCPLRYYRRRPKSKKSAKDVVIKKGNNQ